MRWVVPSTGAVPGDHLQRIDGWLLAAILAVAALGLVIVYSSSSVMGVAWKDGNDLFYLQSQLIRCLLGIGMLLALTRLDARLLGGKTGWILWAGPLLLLLLLLLPTGPAVELRGTRRWMCIFGQVFQPSEFARVMMIVLLAGLLARDPAALKTWRGLLPPLAVVVVTAGLIALQPHMSLALLTAAGGFVIIFLAGACLWRLTVVGTLGLAMAAAAAYWRGGGYHFDRVGSFVCSVGGGDRSYQVQQSILAIGSGGVLGRGLGAGMPKYFFLPDAHTDFILSIVVEELGFVGMVGLFLLLGFIVQRIFALGVRCSSRFGALLCYGVGFQILLSLLIHAAVCLGVAPTTGIPLPLVSFGGSALVANFVSLGLVLSITRRRQARARFHRRGRQPLLLHEPALGRGRR